MQITFPSLGVVNDDVREYRSHAVEVIGAPVVTYAAFEFPLAAELADASVALYDAYAELHPDADPEALFSRVFLEAVQNEIEQCVATGLVSEMILGQIDILNALATLGLNGPDYQFRVELGPHATEPDLAVGRISLVR